MTPANPILRASLRNSANSSGVTHRSTGWWRTDSPGSRRPRDHSGQNPDLGRRSAGLLAGRHACAQDRSPDRPSRAAAGRPGLHSAGPPRGLRHRRHGLPQRPAQRGPARHARRQIRRQGHPRPPGRARTARPVPVLRPGLNGYHRPPPSRRRIHWPGVHRDARLHDVGFRPRHIPDRLGKPSTYPRTAATASSVSRPPDTKSQASAASPAPSSPTPPPTPKTPQPSPKSNQERAAEIPLAAKSCPPAGSALPGRHCGDQGGPHRFHRAGMTGHQLHLRDRLVQQHGEAADHRAVGRQG